MQPHGIELNVKSYKGERECSSHTTTSVHIMIMSYTHTQPNYTSESTHAWAQGRAVACKGQAAGQPMPTNPIKTHSKKKIDGWIKICCLKECLSCLNLRALDYCVLRDLFFYWFYYSWDGHLQEWCEQISGYPGQPPMPRPTPHHSVTHTATGDLKTQLNVNLN